MWLANRHTCGPRSLLPDVEANSALPVSKAGDSRRLWQLPQAAVAVLVRLHI
jgi:hypothetical protein